MKTIEQLLHEIRPEADYDSSTNFVAAELLDSLDIIRLVTSLDENFLISIDGSDITIENFMSVESIKRMVQKYIDKI